MAAKNTKNEVRERPLLFSVAMVRAILEGRKTQTRRVVKYIPALGDPECWCDWSNEPKFRAMAGDFRKFCPYGQPGDRLWVREKFQPIWDNEFDADWKTGKGYAIGYPATDGIQEYTDMRADEEGITTRCKPSIFMPRWASRITLEVVSIHVERLQDISPEDSIAEGVRIEKGSGLIDGEDCYMMTTNSGWMRGPTGAIAAYKNLWESINGPNSCELNPWVWVVEFRRVAQ